MTRTRSISTLGAWAIAAVLAWVVLAPGPVQVHVDAAMTASSDGFTLLTSRTRDQRVGTDIEVVYCIDHRRGMLLVYTLKGGLTLEPHIEMLDGGRIETLFERARASSPLPAGTQSGP